MKKMKSIRKRWIMNSISAALLIVLLAVTAFSVAMASYYYSNMSTELEEKIKIPVRYFSSFQTREACYQNALTFVIPG